MHPRYARLVVLSVLLTLSVALNSQSKTQVIAQIMQTYHDHKMFDGAVLVAEQGKVIYKNAFGMANREWNIPNTTDTRFMLGSISKPITALLVLIQVQKGLIDLDKTISDYIPEFSSANGKRIRVRQLLNHSSGIPGYEIMPDFFPTVSRKYFERAGYIKLFMDSALLFEPGTHYAYSSWGYFTLGYMLERVSGKSYSQLMKEDIFDKLGMSGSGSYYHTQIIPKRATGYDYSVNSYQTGDFRDQSNTLGTGDIYSTVEDLFKLHLALSEHTLLNPALTAEMFTPGILPWGYGFGWFNQQWKYTPTDSVGVNYHLGMTEGFISFIIRIPSTNSLVVFLCNASPTDFFGIAGNLIKALYKVPVKIKEPVHKVLARTIETKGIAAAVNDYDRLLKDTSRYYAEWWNIDQLGHQLMDRHRTAEAFQIFSKNAVQFPTRDIVFVSLGRCLEKMGKEEEARSNYQKAIALNPGNEEARTRLKLLDNKKS